MYQSKVSRQSASNLIMSSKESSEVSMKEVLRAAKAVEKASSRASALAAKASEKEAAKAAKAAEKAAALSAKEAAKAAKASAKASKTVSNKRKAGVDVVVACPVPAYVEKDGPPEIKTEELEEEIEVDEVEWRGQSYLVAGNGDLYNDAYEVVGKWTNHAVSGSEPAWA